MSTSFELIDQLYRSRKTILQILANRGYDTKPYENFGPGEIEAMLVASTSNKDKDNGSAFRIDVERNVDENSKWSESPIKRCRVIYSFSRLKNRLGKFIASLTDEDEDKVNPADTEVIVILALPEGEAVADAFHSISYSLWTSSKLRISFFRLANLVIHPAEHVLVPKHEYIPKKEAEKLFTTQARLKLPFIRFHEDMQARILGLVPHDIVKITRPSPSAGEYTIYRICA
jgi:DNA-directed RNA polymerase subunit H (RpoH/RPB5)